MQQFTFLRCRIALRKQQRAAWRVGRQTVSDAINMQLLERVGKLERLVRRLELGIAVAGALLIALIATAVVRMRSTTLAGDTLSVRQLDITDAKGTQRVVIGVAADGPEVKLLGADGKDLVADLSGYSHGAMLALNYGLGTGTPEMAIISADQAGSGLELEGRGPVGGKGSGLLRLRSHGSAASFQMWDGGDMSEHLDLEATDEGPSVRLADRGGYSSTLGAEETVIGRTGEHQKTSAASLVLFGNDGKVLWSAP